MKKWRVTSYWVKLYKRYVQNTTNMRILKIPIALKPEHAEENWWEIWNQRPKFVQNQLKKPMQQKMKKKLFPCVIYVKYIPRGNCVSQRCSKIFQLAGYTILASHNVDKNSKFTTEYSRALGSYAHGRTCNEERHWSSKMKITALHRETKNTGTSVSMRPTYCCSHNAASPWAN